MSILLTLLAAALAKAAQAPIDAPMQLNYQGSVALREEDSGGRTRKAFDLTLWVMKSGPTGAEVFWLLDERGRGGWPWSERFGRLLLDRRLRSRARGPSLLYDRGDGRSAIPLVLPLIVAGKPLAAGTSWRDDPLEFQVEKADKRGARDVWQIAVRDGFGPKRTLWVDQNAPLLAALDERVVMDKGKDYQLKMELLGSEKVESQKLEGLGQALNELVAMRNKLNQGLDSQEIQWKPAQVAMLRERLPQLAELSVGTPVEKLVATAIRDLELQVGRTGAVAELSAKFVGNLPGKFSVEGTAGESLTDESLLGHVTVLHFWEYRDEPLKEPYGQVGYLDFLYLRRKAAGVKVYGVDVDGRLGDQQARGAAVRSAKKLKDFMNLSYPVLLDSGPLVKQFGDPRLAGAALPLFVVIGRDGKILHYHVGHYEVKQDQGLKDLDDVVVKALEKKPS